MKKSVLALLAAALLVSAGIMLRRHRNPVPPAPGGPVATQTATPDGQSVEWAFRQHLSRVRVHGSGRVSRILPDDTRGRRHQKFILRLASGRTLLIAHNIDLAPRIANLKVGDEIEFSGEYEWNPAGGLVHWTHHAPRGRHPSGWLRHNGKTYR